MRIVIALGGDALLRRGEPLTEENQSRNIAVAAASLAPITQDNALVITHGNGPQVGLLAMQSAAFGPSAAYPLDVLDAETEGMVGYLRFHVRAGDALDLPHGPPPSYRHKSTSQTSHPCMNNKEVKKPKNNSAMPDQKAGSD